MANLIFSELSRIRINKQSRFLTLLNKVKALDTFPLTDEAKKEFGIDNVVLEPTPEFVSVLEDIINKQQEGIKIEPKDFKQFFQEHDRRRGTDFVSTFPELEYWYENIT